MATKFEIECALMAGASYITTRKPLNQFPIPAEWNELLVERAAKNSGFEATCFTKGTDLVISFAGTYPKSLPGTTNGTYLGLAVDLVADLGLASGNGSMQLLEAAKYYLSIKNDPKYAGYNITLTGHSLGGGLAALIGVFFGVTTIAFDQAPFASSAVAGTPDLAAILKADLLANGYTEDQLLGLTGFLQQRQANGGIPNSNKVTNFLVQGEFLSSTPPFNAYSTIGNPATILQHGPSSDIVGMELHAQSLLVAFLQSDRTAQTNSSGIKESFQQVTYKLINLLDMILDKDLYSRDTDTTLENLLERLVRHEFGNAPDGTGGRISANQMLTRFTADLWKLAQDGGLTVNDGSGLGTTYSNWNNVSKALTAFAMQFYYEETTNAKDANKQLFEAISGGVQFDLFSVSEKFQAQFEADGKINLNDAKGYKEYFTKYLSDNPHTFFTAEEIAQINYLLPYLRDWYVQAGADGMVATDTQNRGAFMLGGNGSDTLTGGTADDLLVGNAGGDTLDGGEGNDVLLGCSGEDNLKGGKGVDLLLGGADNDTLDGGAGNDLLKGGGGNDTYTFNGDYGTDIVTDSDGSGSISVDGQALSSATLTFQSVYKDANTGQIFVKLNGGKSLVILKQDSANRIVIDNWQAAGALGITLNDQALPTPTATLTGDFKKLIDTKNAADPSDDVYVVVNGNYVSDGAEANAADLITGSDDKNVKDVINGGGGSDALSGRGGDDYIIGGDGGDIIQGGLGQDTLLGGSGDDDIYGSSDKNLNLPTQVNFTKPVNNIPNPTGTGFNWISGYYSTIGDGVPHGYSNAARNRLADDAGNYIDGGAGNDFIAAGTGADVVHGGADNDFIFGMDNGDILFGDDGNDYIYGDGNQPGNDSVVWTLYENHGNDIIDGGNGNDYLIGQGGDDIVFGGGGNDYIWGDDEESKLALKYHGNDFLFGGDGKDQIVGGGGDDCIEGGLKDDLLLGGTGNDVYYFNKGDGVDTIIDNKSEKNIIRFGAGVDPSKIKLHLGSLMLDMGDGDSIHIADFDQNDVFKSSSITEFEFADGTVLSLTELLARGFDLDGTDGNDYIVGTNTDDRIDGKGGTDALLGGAGNDTYIFRTGDSPLVTESGQQSVEWIQDTAGTDSLQFVDVEPTSIEVQTIAVGEAGDEELLINYGSSDRFLVLDGENGVIEQFEVGGVSLSFSEFVGRYASSIIQGTDTDGRLLLNGGKTDDLLLSDQNNVKASGGRGTDTIRATGDAVTLEYSLGDGHDYVTTGGSGDVLSLGDGITLADVTVVSANNGALVLQIGTEASDRISFTNFSARNPLAIKPFDSIAFADGSSVTYEDFIAQGFSITGTDGEETLYGLTGNDELDGGAGADRLIGGAGSDIYHWGSGSGHDTIDSSGNTDSDVDTIELGEGLTADTLQFIHRGDDLLIRSMGGADQLTVLDQYSNGAIGSIEFADGTRWEASEIAQNAIDMFELTAQQGAVSVDEYSSISAIVQLGSSLSFTDLITTKSGNDLLLQVRGTESSLRLENYYSTDPAIWSAVDANGETTTLDALLDATATLQADRLASLKQDFVTWAKLGLTEQLSSAGYTQAEDGSWEKNSAWLSASNTHSQTTQVTFSTYTWFDGRPSSTTVSNYLNESWTRTGWGSGTSTFGITEWSANVVQSQIIGDGDVVYSDTYNSSSITSRGWVAVHWVAQSEYADNYQFQTFNWINGIVSDVPQAIGYIQSSSSVNYKKTTYSAVLDEALTVENVQDGTSAVYAALPNALPGWVNLTQVTYNIEEIDLTDGDHVVFGDARSIVIGGTGNNSIYNAGFAYGGIGNAYLIGGHILVAGQGDQWLQNGDVMVVGDGSDTVVANAGNEIYIQHSNTDVDLIASNANQGEALLDRLYGELGIADWQERYEHGGQYYCAEEYCSYSDSPSEVLETYLGWGEPPIETLQDILDRGYAVYIEPLPTLITVPDLNNSASSYYDLHHVATQTIYASQWDKLETYVDDGTLTPTTIKFDEGLAVSDISLSWDYVSSPTNGVLHVALGLHWGNEQGIEVLIPNSDDAVGQGLYRFEFADGSSLSLTELMALAPDAPDFDPDFFEFGSESGEVVIDCYEFRGIRVADGIGKSDLNISHDGSDLLISTQDGDSVLRIVDWYADPNMQASTVLKFADDSFWDATKLTQLGMVIDGSAGGVTLESVQGFATTLIAGPGDTLIGYNPGDIYQYALGAGVVHIQDSGGGIIQFGAGITPEMISLGLGSLLLHIGDQGDEIHLDNFDPAHADAPTTVQYFQFADGTELSYLQLLERGFDIYGTDGDDVLTGTNLDNRIYAGDGDDILTASGQFDTLYAGAGNDLLIANDGGDVLVGGSGRTEFQTQVGNGMVTIDDSVVKTSSTESDLLRWDGEVSAQDVSISFVDGDVLLASKVNEGDGVILSKFLQGTAINLPRIEFSDGSYITSEFAEGVYVLTSYDSTGEAQGERWEFHRYDGGNWSWSTSNADGETTTWGASLAGGGYSNATRVLLDDGQVQVVESYFFPDSTQNYTVDTTTDSDGSYQQFTSWSNGDYQEKYYESEWYETWGTLSRPAEGYVYYFDTVTNPDGVTETWDTYEYTDGATYDVHRVLQSDGSYALDWSRSDGTSGTDALAVDGTRTVSWYAAAGNYTRTTTRPDGSSLVENFDSTDFLQSDTWVAADGSSGNDWFNTDGSYGNHEQAVDGSVTDTWHNADNSYGSLITYADGHTLREWHAATGEYTVTATSTDGSERVENFDSSGFLQSDTWTDSAGNSGNDWYNPDGSYGTHIIGADASVVDVWHNADGSYSFTKTDADGNVTHGGVNLDGSEGTETRDAAGGLVGDSWIAADGSQRVDAAGNALLVGTAGSDLLWGGTGKALLAGGSGNDVLQLGADSDIVAFNLGDGQDTLVAGSGGGNIVSLGGALSASDLAFEKIGNDLVLDVGSNDSLTFENWYGSSASQSFTTLQLSSGQLGDTAAIDQYSFSQLVAAFDAARTANSTLTAWQLSTELLNARLSTSGEAALGGELAFSYATQGNLSGVSVSTAQSTLSSTLFATNAQTVGQSNSVGTEVAYLH